jgi:hypothetical protein
MLLSEALMVGTVMTDRDRPLTVLRLALAAEEVRPLGLQAELREFQRRWPWVTKGALVGPEWSLRAETLTMPLTHLVEIFQTEVLPGRVSLERLVDWVRLLEEANEPKEPEYEFGFTDRTDL